MGCACPLCGKTMDDYISNLDEDNHLTEFPNFCPNCGAEMEKPAPPMGEVDDENIMSVDNEDMDNG